MRKQLDNKRESSLKRLLISGDNDQRWLLHKGKKTIVIYQTLYSPKTVHHIRYKSWLPLVKHHTAFFYKIAVKSHIRQLTFLTLLEFGFIGIIRKEDYTVYF